MLVKTRRARSRNDGPRRPRWSRGRRATPARTFLDGISAVAASVLAVGSRAHLGRPSRPAMTPDMQRDHNRAQWDLYPCTRVHGAEFETEFYPDATVGE